MGDSNRVFNIAFSFLKKMTPEILREIFSRGISGEEFFKLPTKELINKLGIRHDHEFDSMAREEALTLARIELEKIKDHNIEPLFIFDENYPSQLAETYDAPLVLYKLGEADLECEHILAIVGTRKPTPYGVSFCNNFIEDIRVYFEDAVIVSGLAYGIDATAHKQALEKGLTTVAVVAHGLNMIYPAAHRNLAKEIIRNGGAILSEYPFGVKPFRANFLARNRIVAGISGATIVVESNIKGGAMSTANYAFLYNRDVMALPGRLSDELSSGCNLLIRKQKAHLIESAADLIEETGWNPIGLPVKANQRNLFPELTGYAKTLFELLQNSQEPMQADRLVAQSGLPVSVVLGLLNELEFDGLILHHPGNRYSIS